MKNTLQKTNNENMTLFRQTFKTEITKICQTV